MPNLTIGVDDTGKIIPEIALNQMLKQLRSKLYLTNFITKEADLVDGSEIVPIGVGKTVNINLPGTITRIRRTDPDAATTNQKYTMGSTQVTVDQNWYVRFSHQDIVTALTKRDMSGTVIGSAIAALAEGVESDLAAVITANVPSANKIGPVSAMTEGHFSTMREVMLAANAPTEGRMAFLSGNATSDVITTPRFSQMDTIGDPTAIMEGKAPKVQQFVPVESNLVSKVAGQSPFQYQNLFFHKWAAVLVMRPLPIPKNAKATVVVDPESGLALRLVEFFDSNTVYDTYQLDILYGVGKLRSEMSGMVITT